MKIPLISATIFDLLCTPGIQYHIYEIRRQRIWNGGFGQRIERGAVADSQMVAIAGTVGVVRGFGGNLGWWSGCTRLGRVGKLEGI